MNITLNESLSSFKRREFAEFSYLKVELKTWQAILIYVLSLIISIGLNLWVSKNEFNDSN